MICLPHTPHPTDPYTSDTYSPLSSWHDLIAIDHDLSKCSFRYCSFYSPSTNTDRPYPYLPISSRPPLMIKFLYKKKKDMICTSIHYTVLVLNPRACSASGSWDQLSVLVLYEYFLYPTSISL